MPARQRWFSRPSIDRFVHARSVQNIVIVVILINAAILGMETVPALHHAIGDILIIADRVCLAVFVVELALKLYALGWSFFRSAWNVFDFIVVAISLIPGADSFAVLRALRVLRVLRLISAVPAMRRVVDALVRAIPGITSIAGLLSIVFYVGAVMATMLFGHDFPDEFGSLGASLFSLFQIMTLDNWSVIARTVIAQVPWAWAFFVPFILISALTVLNLFIAVIVDAMTGLDHREDAAAGEQTAAAATPEPAHDDVAAELAALRAEVAALSATIRANAPQPGPPGSRSV